MSDPTRLDDCGCCGGAQDRVPSPLFNRPGLRQVAYRMGTWHTFRQSMLARLAGAGLPPEASLRRSADDDFTVALIDAWAVAGDVLTFSIERTTQEHYLATATERRSVDALVQLIGYRLGPGVAATTWLAFTLETAPDPTNGFRPAPVPGVPATVPIPAGVRVQSVPNPGELPQTFETVEPIEALAAWNSLQARRTKVRFPQTGDTDALLAGVGLDLTPGDVLLFVASDWSGASADSAKTRWDLRRVTAVTPDPVAQRTRVTWSGKLEKLDLDAKNPKPVSVFAMRQRASLFGYNAPDPRLFSDQVYDRLKGNGQLAGTASETTRSSDWLFNEIVSVDDPRSNQESARLLDVRLSTVLRGIDPGSWVVLTNPAGGADPLLGPIFAVSEQARSKYGVSAQITSVTIDRQASTVSQDTFDGPNVRTTAVLLDSQPLALAENPDLDPVAGTEIPLAHDLDAPETPRAILVRGRHPRASLSGDNHLTVTADDGAQQEVGADQSLIVLGLDADPEGGEDARRWRLQTADGFVGTARGASGDLAYGPAEADAPVVGEMAVAVDVTSAEGGPTLVLKDPLANAYDRATVEIFGNVARATHGETTPREVLGSGDGSRPFQSFTLRKQPLTYVRGTTAGKIGSTLEVWVNDIRWREVTTLFGQGPRDRVYVTRTANDGTTVITFGDGESGARLPTGQDNVVAHYRTGSGMDGELDAAQLSLLMDRPLGVRSATNPLAPEGAAPPQAADDARENAPRTVLTLGRIVSLRDYEDFARTYLGIDKAAAVWTWDGVRRGVLITVAGVGGKSVGDELHDALVDAIAAAGSTRVPFVVKGYRPATFRVAATLRVAPDRDPDTVLQAVRDALATRFAFAARAFGQMVALSEVYAAIHAVPGVVSADINLLYRGATSRLDAVLVAEAPVNGDPPEAAAAELLTLDPASLDDLEVVP